VGWVSWKQIVEEFLEAKGNRELLKVWTNTRLALTFEEYHPEREENTLKNLCDDRPRGVVPSEGVLALTAGVDVQDYGFYYVIRAWGDELESWLIREGYVESWEAVERVLWGSKYEDAEEQAYIINAIFVDAMGHRTSEVYDFCRDFRICWPIKGEQRMAQPWKISRIDFYPGTSQPIPGGLHLVRINTTYFKDLLSSKLQISPGDPGAFHLHAEITEEYLSHLCAEYRSEKGIWEVIRQRENHMLDCEVYALAAADYLGIKHWLSGPPQKRRKRQSKPVGRRRRW
jgi:phage terminase large subunit GpA-like protein